MRIAPARKRAPALIAAAAFASFVAATGQSPDPIVSVIGGQVRGAQLAGGGAVFKGIPYAAAPIGDLRWRDPRPVQPWAGVRDAMAFGPPCPQVQRDNSSFDDRARASREDCLFLNVWTAQWPARAGRPVIVTIHGGGNFSGGATDGPDANGEHLSRHGVVVVTFHFRLGVLGFLAHSELSMESRYGVSGNYGLLDQIAALHWVRENVSRFGGDPANVTLMGGSTGSTDISFLMTSPLAKGLFHRAIVRSGPLGQVSYRGARNTGPIDLSVPRTLEQEERDGRAFADALKAPGDRSVPFMRQMSAAELVKQFPPRQPIQYLVVDGYVIPKSPPYEFAAGRQHAIPLLVGSTARDYPPTGATDTSALPEAYGPLTDRAVALYKAPDSKYGTPAEQWTSDRTFRCGSVQQALWHAQAGHPTFQYQFSRVPAGRETYGARHGLDGPYLFGTFGQGAWDPLRGSEPRFDDLDREVSATLQKYWISFAKAGNPNDGTLPEWPRFDAIRRAFLEFTDSGPVVGESLRREHCELHVENVRRLMSGKQR